MAFLPVAKITDLEVNEKKCITVQGKKLVLIRLEDGYYVVDNTCPHKQGQLCDGRVDGKKGEIICGLHGWNFDIKTGVSPYNPNDPNDKIATFPVKIEGDEILVEVPEGKQSAKQKGYLAEWDRPHDETEDRMETVHKMSKGWIGSHGETKTTLG